MVIIAIFCFKDLGIERLWIKFGCGSRTRFISIHQVVSAMPHCDIIAPSLPLFHALAGFDTVSSMLGIGKKRHGLAGCEMLKIFAKCLPP